VVWAGGEQTNMNQDLAHVISSILETDKTLGQQAARAVNVSLTLRNWLIGFYIAEYELHGSDRAQYGQGLLKTLSERLNGQISNVGRRQLYGYLLFFRVYPQMIEVLSQQHRALLLHDNPERILPTVLAQLDSSIYMLVQSLSYSHFALFVDLDNDLRRRFYEQRSLEGGWSQRELKRQIGSLLYERTAHLESPNKTSKPFASRLEIKDPYVFEFLGIKPNETVAETKLEHGLLEKIQQFILELGNGFCFEARQKRILIGHEHFFVDLVFYHRILKCHVLLELKIGDFSQEQLGQLNTYVSWYKRHMMSEGDNPPIGILLCNQKNEALVEYALAGMNNDLFVSKYLLELPSKETIARFLAELEEGLV
jgi:predicted nuclease of restriction endonuclease-like (RecB) superfamily